MDCLPELRNLWLRILTGGLLTEGVELSIPARLSNPVVGRFASEAVQLRRLPEIYREGMCRKGRQPFEWQANRQM